jgi:hypothetical protein
MTQAKTKRRVARWLVGLFLVAQIAGVIPLIAAHTLHVFEDKQVVSGGHGFTAVGPHGTHHHGLADLNDQCCAFHHLSGVLPFAVKAAPVRNAKLAIWPSVPRALVLAEPKLLERPPKSLS